MRATFGERVVLPFQVFVQHFQSFHNNLKFQHELIVHTKWPPLRTCESAQLGFLWRGPTVSSFKKDRMQFRCLILENETQTCFLVVFSTFLVFQGFSNFCEHYDLFNVVADAYIVINLLLFQTSLRELSKTPNTFRIG